MNQDTEEGTGTSTSLATLPDHRSVLPVRGEAPLVKSESTTPATRHKEQSYEVALLLRYLLEIAGETVIIVLIFLIGRLLVGEQGIFVLVIGYPIWGWFRFRDYSQV